MLGLVLLAADLLAAANGAPAGATPSWLVYLAACGGGATVGVAAVTYVEHAATRAARRAVTRHALTCTMHDERPDAPADESG